MRFTIPLLAGFVLVFTAGAVRAQAAAPASRPAETSDVVPEAVSGRALAVGAALGSGIGFLGGQAMQWEEDYLAFSNVPRPGLGSVLGGIVGVEVAIGGGVPVLHALGASLVGAAAGFVTAVVVQSVTDGALRTGGFVVTYALADGVVTSALTRRWSFGR